VANTNKGHPISTPQEKHSFCLASDVPLIVDMRRDLTLGQ
jgi:hypothetical protein